ncbi:MAG: hypothetical protein ACLP05_12895 [Candidatus Kryptoniota bacterium]
MKNNSVYFRPALFAGLIMSIINFVPGLNLVNCFCCAGLFVGGVLAVIFFNMDLPQDQPIMSIDGFYLGLWTGIFAAGFETVLEITIGPFIADVRFRMMENLVKKLPGNVQIPGDIMDMINQAIAAAKRPLLLNTLVSFFFVVIMYSIFTIFGALLTSAFIQKQKRKQP